MIKRLAGKFFGKVTIVVPNFEQSAFNMAGSVETAKPRQARYKPCSQPFGGMYIDYHGFVMPCCLMRYDLETFAIKIYLKYFAVSGS